MAESCSGMNIEIIKSQNLGSLLMKSSQSNFNLQGPGSYLAHSYLITTVRASLASFGNFLLHQNSSLFLG